MIWEINEKISSERKTMIISAVTVKLHAPFVHTLKEKRAVIKSIMAKLKNRFNISVIEADDHDMHKIAVIGIAYVSISKEESVKILDSIIDYIDNNCEAQIVEVIVEA